MLNHWPDFVVSIGNGMHLPDLELYTALTNFFRPRQAKQAKQAKQASQPVTPPELLLSSRNHLSRI
jgi:hypothetical protein